MQAETTQDDRHRDMALLLRAACRRDTTFKHDAMRGPSMNTVCNRLVQQQAIEHEFTRDITHQTIMLKAGIRLGLIQAT